MAIGSGKGVNEMKDVSVSELQAQRAELLPARETLYNVNLAEVWAANSSTALNIVTQDSQAYSAALQNIFVVQG